MLKTSRKPRADAEKNRGKVLKVAFEVFASEGFAVPIDEIARRAGVGAGTVYRHFPAKEDLFRAVIRERLDRLVQKAEAVLVSEAPGEAIYAFMRLMIFNSAADRAIGEALAGITIDLKEVDEIFLDIVERMLSAARRARTIRRDVGVLEIKALVVGCQAMVAHNPKLGEHATEVVFDGLRRVHR
jgi:AcrR family transcriptional regulator